MRRATQSRCNFIESSRGVLFVCTQGLGDVVQSLPLLRAICESNQNRCPVYALFASSEHYEIVRAENLEIVPVFTHGNSRFECSILSLWGKLAGKVDLIVAAPEVSAAKLVLLKYAIGARRAFGEASFPFNRFLTGYANRSWEAPWQRTLTEIGGALHLEAHLRPARLHLTSCEMVWAKSLLAHTAIRDSEALIGIQFSAAVPQKCWPVACFANLVQQLHRGFPQLHVVSFGSQSDRPQSEEVRRCVGKVPWIEGAGEWNLRQTMAMLRQCDLFISGDTGLMHIAAALGVPTVSIFGPTSVARRAPTHNRGVALWPRSSCHPCFRGKWIPCDCIRDITPEEVLACTRQMLLQSWKMRLNTGHSFDSPEPVSR